jgi:hypothetical protein
MGFVSYVKSIAWTISLASGKPSKCVGKTSKYSSTSFPTISFVPFPLMGSFIGSCTLMVNNFASLCAHVKNYLRKNKKVSSKVCIFVSSKMEPLGFVL